MRNFNHSPHNKSHNNSNLDISHDRLNSSQMSMLDGSNSNNYNSFSRFAFQAGLNNRTKNSS